MSTIRLLSLRLMWASCVCAVPPGSPKYVIDGVEEELTAPAPGADTAAPTVAGGEEELDTEALQDEVDRRPGGAQVPGFVDP